MTITNLQTSDAGAYSVVVSNSAGSVTSQVAVLTVIPNIQRLTNAVMVTCLAGFGVPGYADGPGANAQFNSPNGGWVDAVGNVFIADSSNHRIRKVTPEGTVSTLAGTGVPGYLDGRADQAMFNLPLGVCVDTNGNVFVADTGNNRIRKISPDGVVSTVAGGGLSGYVDGVGTGAWFNFRMTW